MTDPAPLPMWADYPGFVRRHRARIGALMGVGVLVGLAWSSVQPTTYSATASVVLAPVPKYVLPTGVGLAPPEVSIDTDAQLLRSPKVLAAVGDVLGTNAEVARGRLSVTASANSHVLHVTVAAPDAPAAADAANAAVAALVQVRRETLGSLRLDELRLLRLWLDGQETLLAQEQDRRLVIPASDDLYAQLVDLRTGLEELEGARVTPAQVLSPAVAASKPDYPNTEVPVMSGAMVGLLAGCLLGRRHDRRRMDDQTPHSPQLSPRHASLQVAALTTTRG